MIACGACGVTLGTRYEHCCYCPAHLCAACWDALGHCGHPGCEDVQAEAAARVGDHVDAQRHRDCAARLRAGMAPREAGV